MATRTAPAAQAAIQPKGLRTGLVAVTSTFSVRAGESISSGDVIQMIKVPANATPVYIACHFGIAPNVNASVGDGLSEARYITSGVRSTGNGWITINQVTPPYQYSQDDTIDIKLSLVTATTVLGGFNMVAIFSMDPGNYTP